VSLRSAHVLPLAALLLAGCGRAPAGPPDRVIVLVLVDTLRRDSLSCYGNARDVTPSIDALAADGLRFEQAIAASGWTLPSTASLLTGVSPLVHKAEGRGTRLTPVSPDVPTGAELLRAAGFRTVAFTNAAFVNPLLGLTRGFDVVSHHHAYNHEIRRANRTVDEALAVIADHGGRDTFALIHLFDPHLDYAPPARFAELYREGLDGPRPPFAWEDCTDLELGEVGETPDPARAAAVRAAYDAEVHFVDRQIGRLVAELERLGLYRNATLIVTADHGEEFWDHAGFEHGHSLYDELVRVPLVVRFPADLEDVPRGVVVGAQVRLIDVLPTVFELAGVVAPDLFEGRSLLPLARGEAEDERVAFSFGTLYGEEDASALRTGRYKLIVDPERGSTELYDWVRDPGEQDDLAQREPELVARLRGELETLMAELRASAADFREGELQRLAPAEMEDVLEQLRSLGYLGDE